MERDEPQVGDARGQHRIRGARRVEPCEERVDFGVEPRGVGRFELHGLASQRPGYDLHRP